MENGLTEAVTNKAFNCVLHGEAKRHANYERDLDEFAEDFTQKILRNVTENMLKERYERKLDEVVKNLTETVLDSVFEEDSVASDDEITELVDWMLDKVVNYVRREERLGLKNADGPSSSVVSLTTPSFDLTTIGLKVFDTEFKRREVTATDDLMNKPTEMHTNLTSASLLKYAPPPLDENKWSCPFNKITRVYSNATYNECTDWGWKVVVGYPKLCHPNLERKLGKTNLQILHEEESRGENSPTGNLSQEACFAEPAPGGRTSKIKRFFGRLFSPRINWAADRGTYDSFDQKVTEFIERNRRTLFRRRFRCSCFGGRRSTSD